jgi:hypothetical protein
MYGVREGCGPCKIKSDPILYKDPNSPPPPPPPPTKESKTPWKIKKLVKKNFFN